MNAAPPEYSNFSKINGLQKFFCVDGPHMSNIKDILKYEERTSKTQELVKVRMGICDVCDQVESKIFTR